MSRVFVFLIVFAVGYFLIMFTILCAHICVHLHDINISTDHIAAQLRIHNKMFATRFDREEQRRMDFEEMLKNLKESEEENPQEGESKDV